MLQEHSLHCLLYTSDVGSMKEKVARGVQYAEDMWSWKHWAVEFVEAAKEC